MKALSLTQPWASLVAIGSKRIETRSWSTDYRGRIAIHAAKAFPREAREFYEHVRLQSLLRQGVHGLPDPLPLGAIVATALLVRVQPTGDVVAGVSELEFRLGNFGPERFAWILNEIVPLEIPIPARGARRLWDWNAARGHAFA